MVKGFYSVWRFAIVKPVLTKRVIRNSAERIGFKKENTEVFLGTSEPIVQSKEDCLHEYCSHLVKHSKPSKKETLLNSIKSKFKVNNIDPEELFEELMKQGIIIVNENKITYIQQKLTEFASQ